MSPTIRHVIIMFTASESKRNAYKWISNTLHDEDEPLLWFNTLVKKRVAVKVILSQI